MKTCELNGINISYNETCQQSLQTDLTTSYISYIFNRQHRDQQALWPAEAINSVHV